MSNEKKKIDLTPLNENEAGQIAGGFTEMAAPENPDTEGLNTVCPVNVATCCVPTTSPAT